MLQKNWLPKRQNLIEKKKFQKTCTFTFSGICTYFFSLFLYFLTCCVAASCDINPFSMIKSFLYNIMSVRTVLLFFGIGLNRNQKNWQFSCQIGSYPNWKLYLGFTATHGSIFGEKNMKIWQLLWWKLDRRIKYVLSKNTFVQFLVLIKRQETEFFHYWLLYTTWVYIISNFNYIPYLLSNFWSLAKKSICIKNQAICKYKKFHILMQNQNIIYTR